MLSRANRMVRPIDEWMVTKLLALLLRTHVCVCVFRLFHVVRKFISITFFVLCCSHDLSISRYILTMFREKSANFFLLVLFNDFSDSLTAAENAWAINAAKLLQINMKQSNVSQHFSGVSTFFDMKHRVETGLSAKFQYRFWCCCRRSTFKHSAGAKNMNYSYKHCFYIAQFKYSFVDISFDQQAKWN